MIRKILGNISWRYAIGEIILIFIGITIAIWFNNWNESKKARIVEVKSLIEIKEAISQDLGDIKENIAGFTYRVKLYLMLLNHIENELPLSEELKNLFPFLQGITTFLSHIGPYETLKSRGIEIITNDTIRNKVSMYYDLEYERIQTNEKQHHNHYNDYIKTALMKHFDLSKPKIEPLNYEELIKDKEFKQSIYWAYKTDSYMLEIYRKMEGKGEELLLDLKKEIKRLN